MYCESCGQPVKPTDKFCRICGSPVTGGTSASSETAAGAESVRRTVVSKAPLTIKNLSAKINTPAKKTAVAVGLIVILFLLSVPVYNSFNDADKTLNKIITAVEKQDIGTLSGLVKTQTGRDLSPEAVKAFAVYYSQNLSDLIDKSQVSTDKSSKYRLDKQTFIGYGSYKLKVPTRDLQVSSIKGAVFHASRVCFATKPGKAGAAKRNSPKSVEFFLHREIAASGGPAPCMGPGLIGGGRENAFAEKQKDKQSDIQKDNCFYQSCFDPRFVT